MREKGGDLVVQAMKAIGSINFTDDSRSDRSAVCSLRQELEKGVRSAKNGEVYTIEEAWKEIDKV